MEWKNNISSIFIVEDNIYTNHASSLVFPDSLFEDYDAENVRNAFLQIDDPRVSEKMLEVLDVFIRGEYEAFLYNGKPEDYRKLIKWYESGGKEKWQGIFSSNIYSEEYSFLDNIEEDKIVQIFTDYSEALDYLEKNDLPVHDDKVNLWLLDRELDNINRDIDILNLLELIESKSENSIGIIYSGKVADIDNRDKIYRFVRDTIDQNKPLLMKEDIINLIAELKQKNPQALFLGSDEFIKELVNLFKFAIDLKVDLNNLVWVMPKSGPIEDKIEEAMLKARCGFELHKLLKIHMRGRKKSLHFGLEQTTKLQIEDIKYLKKKSVSEGTNISDTLVRIHDVYSSQYLAEELVSDPDYHKVIRNIESWDIEESDKPHKEFDELLYREKFVSTIKDYYSPIAAGDIFEIKTHPQNNGRKSTKYAMLLTQQCDCIVRKDNNGRIKRRVDMATLIEVTPKKINVKDQNLLKELEAIASRETIDDSLKSELRGIVQNYQNTAATKEHNDTINLITFFPFLHNGEYCELHVHLRRIAHIDFKLLDMCSMNSEGYGTIDLNNIERIKSYYIKLYPKYYQSYLLGIIDIIVKEIGDKGDITTFDGSISFEDRNIGTYIKNGSVIDYRLRRIAKIRNPYQTYIQACFGLTQGNIGLPMQF